MPTTQNCTKCVASSIGNCLCSSDYMKTNSAGPTPAGWGSGLETCRPCETHPTCYKARQSCRRQQQSQTYSSSSNKTAHPRHSLSLPELLEAHVAVAVLLHDLGNRHLKVLLRRGTHAAHTHTHRALAAMAAAAAFTLYQTRCLLVDSGYTVQPPWQQNSMPHPRPQHEQPRETQTP